MSDVNQPRQPEGAPGGVGGQYMTGGYGTGAATLPAPGADDGTQDVFTRKYPTVKEKVEALQAELARATDDFAADPAKWQAWLTAAGTFYHYSWGNQMLIRLARPDASRVAGFRRWEELGRQVRKGSHGIPILRPVLRRLPVLDANGKPKTGDDGKPEMVERMTGWSTTSVFAMEDTDPIPGQEDRLHISQVGLSEEPPEGLREDLEAAIGAYGYRVEYRPLPQAEGGGTFAGYTAKESHKVVAGALVKVEDKRVVIGTHLRPGGVVKTLAHELGHIAAGHLEDDERYKTGESGHRGMMEMEAEGVAFILTRANGLRTTADYSAAYLANWQRDPSAHTDDRAALAKSGERIRKATQTLLTTQHWRNAGGDNLVRSAAEQDAARAKARTTPRSTKRAPARPPTR